MILTPLVLSALFFGSLSQTPAFDQDYYFIVDYCFDKGTNQSAIYRCSTNGVQLYEYDDSNTCMGNDVTVSEYHGCDHSGGQHFQVANCSTAQSAHTSTSLDDCYYWMDGQYDDPRPLEVCTNGGCSGGGDSCIDIPIVESDGNITIHQINYNEYDCYPQTYRNNQTFEHDEYYYINVDGSEECFVQVREYDWSATTTFACMYDKSQGNRYLPPKAEEDCSYLYDDGGNLLRPDFCYHDRSGFYAYSWEYECQESGDVILHHWLDSEDCSGSGNKYYVRSYDANNYTINCNGKTCSGEYTNKGCNIYNNDRFSYNEALMCGGCFHYYEDWPERPEVEQNLMVMLTTLGKYDWLSRFWFFDGTCDSNGIVHFDINGDYSSSCKPRTSACGNSRGDVAKQQLELFYGYWPDY